MVSKATPPQIKPIHYLAYGFLGFIFGITLIKSEVVSWFRIQEMFRFQAFHMYGVIGSAVLVAGISLFLIKRFGARDVHDRPVMVAPKEMNGGINVSVGGLLFGFGWALTGACPGPLYALIGSGFSVMIASLLSALLGTWVYGILKPRLPH